MRMRCTSLQQGRCQAAQMPGSRQRAAGRQQAHTDVQRNNNTTVRQGQWRQFPSHALHLHAAHLQEACASQPPTPPPPSPLPPSPRARRGGRTCLPPSGRRSARWRWRPPRPQRLWRASSAWPGGRRRAPCGGPAAGKAGRQEERHTQRDVGGQEREKSEGKQDLAPPATATAAASLTACPPCPPCLLTSPRYFCTNSEPTTRMKEAVVWWATALASIVLPAR